MFKGGVGTDAPVKVVEGDDGESVGGEGMLL